MDTMACQWINLSKRKQQNKKVAWINRQIYYESPMVNDRNKNRYLYKYNILF